MVNSTDSGRSQRPCGGGTKLRAEDVFVEKQCSIYTRWGSSYADDLVLERFGGEIFSGRVHEAKAPLELFSCFSGGHDSVLNETKQ